MEAPYLGYRHSDGLCNFCEADDYDRVWVVKGNRFVVRFCPKCKETFTRTGQDDKLNDELDSLKRVCRISGIFPVTPESLSDALAKLGKLDFAANNAIRAFRRAGLTGD